MPDRISKQERDAIDAFLKKAADEGVSLKQPTGKSAIDPLAPWDYKTHGASASLMKRREYGAKLRNKIALYLKQGLTIQEIAEKMNMSYSNVLYHKNKMNFL